MAIDLENERGITPTEVTRLFPSYHPGKSTHTSRVIRMITNGVRLPDGSRLRLEAIRIGSQWVTTTRCVREFGERLAAAQIAAQSEATSSRSSAARRRAATDATAELDRRGFVKPEKR